MIATRSRAPRSTSARRAVVDRLDRGLDGVAPGGSEREQRLDHRRHGRERDGRQRLTEDSRAQLGGHALQQPQRGGPHVLGAARDESGDLGCEELDEGRVRRQDADETLPGLQREVGDGGPDGVGVQPEVVRDACHLRGLDQGVAVRGGVEGQDRLDHEHRCRVRRDTGRDDDLLDQSRRPARGARLRVEDRVVPAPQADEDAEPRGRAEVRLPAGGDERGDQPEQAHPADRGPPARAASRAPATRPRSSAGTSRPARRRSGRRGRRSRGAGSARMFEGMERHDVVGRLELQEQLRALTTVDVRERAGVQVRRLLARLQRPQHVDQRLRGCVPAQRPPQTFEHVQPFAVPRRHGGPRSGARGAVIVPVSTHRHLRRHPGGGQPASRSSPAIAIGSHVGRLRDS